MTEQENRIKYLQAAYDAALDAQPSGPLSVRINPLELGNRLGFDRPTTERIVKWHVEKGYADSDLGMNFFTVKQEGLDFLESQ